MKDLYLLNGVDRGYYFIESFERSIAIGYDFDYHKVLATQERASCGICYKWIKLKRKMTP